MSVRPVEFVTNSAMLTDVPKLAIMLSRIKMDLPAICRAILEVNDDLLTVDDLKALAKQLPTPDEVNIDVGCHPHYIRLTAFRSNESKALAT